MTTPERKAVIADRAVTLAVIDKHIDGISERRRRANLSGIYGCDLLPLLRTLDDHDALVRDIKRWMQDAWRAADTKRRRKAR